MAREGKAEELSTVIGRADAAAKASPSGDVPAAAGDGEEPIWVDSVDAAAAMVDAIHTLTRGGAHVAFDLEGGGVGLGRDGTLSTMQLCCGDGHSVYVVDVTTLRDDAFDTPGTTATTVTMRHLLESSDVIKLMVDCRADSDALYAHYRVKLAGVQDLQLHHLAWQTRSGGRGPPRFVTGGKKIIAKWSGLASGVQRERTRVTEEAYELFGRSRGASGSDELLAWDERPLLPVLIAYAANDVRDLHAGYKALQAQPLGKYQRSIEAETRARLELRTSATFKAGDRANAFAPRLTRT